MSSPPVIVVLPERAGLPETGPLAAELSRAFSSSATVRVETADTQEITLPVIQVLIAAHRSAQECGARLEVAVPEGSAIAKSLAAHVLDGAPSSIRTESGVWTGIMTTEALQ